MPRAKGLGRHRKEKALASKLDQLRVMTTVVADTGDLGAVACLKPLRPSKGCYSINADLFGVGPTDALFASDAGIRAKRAARRA